MNRVFVNLDSRYADYFQNIQITLEEPCDYWSLYMEWLTLQSYFADELIEWLIEVGFIQYQCHIYIYYKYAPDGTRIVVSSYYDDCV